MNTRNTTRTDERPTKTTTKVSLALVMICSSVAILGIFIGCIVVYGGLQAS